MPKNDFVFKKIFGQNKELLKSLLQSILTDMKIEVIDVVEEAIVEKDLLENKDMRLDILATLEDGTKVDIEMQVKNYYNTVERSFAYLSGEMHKAIKRKQEYAIVSKVVGIWITDYDVFEKENEPYHEKIYLTRNNSKKKATDKIEMHYIQLPKFKRKCKRIETLLEKWLTFINHENLEEIKMINDEKIKEAQEKLEYLSSDEATRRLAQMREQGILDRKLALGGAYMQGKTEGEKNKQIEIAKEMIKEGIEIEKVIKIIKLTKEEIENLK